MRFITPKSISVILVSLLLITRATILFSQNNVENRENSLLQSLELQDTTLIRQDTTLIKRDSLLQSAKDTVNKKKGFLDFEIISTAKDSIVEVFSDGNNLTYYYGGAHIKYGDLEVKADYIVYDFNNKTFYASGLPDTTGKLIGTPEFTQAGKTYNMEEVTYNMETRKAMIHNVVTKEQDGILHGDNLKMMPDKSFNIKSGRYTVCDCPEPHYYLRMTAAKVVTEPKQRTVFGPAYVVVEDVPLFPIVLPFGFVPERPDRAGGLLFPTYGEEMSRGFFLKDLGYYFVFGNHFDLALTTSIYTLGSWDVKATSRYKLRYKFDGGFTFNYSNDVIGEKGSPDYQQSSNFGFSWNHNQDSKARPGTSFRASVNFSSPSNNKYNGQYNSDRLENSISSSISYSKTMGQMNLSINGLHSQNSRDSSYAITLPNITFNVNRFYPFKKKNRVGKAKLWEEISFGYNTSFQNKINFKASEVKDPDFFSKMKNGMNHRFQIGLPGFAILKYLNFSPSLSYGMNWYFQETNYAYDPDTDKLVPETSSQFSTFGISQTYSGSVSMSTRIYGHIRPGPKFLVQDIRHLITPSVSLSYSPELGTKANGWETLHYTDVNGVEKEYSYNRYAGGINSPPSKGQNASMSLSLKNNFEAKVKDKRDTTGTGTKKVKLIDNLDFSTGYNFLAETNKMQNIRMSANTTLFQKIGVSGTMSFDPYDIDENGKKTDIFYLAAGKGLARLTNASLSMSYSISGALTGEGNDGKGTKSQNSTQDYHRNFYHPITGEFIPGGWLYYVNPNVPWSLNLSYSYSYSKSYQSTAEGLKSVNNHMQTLNMNGSLKLTKDLNISLSSGFDLTKLGITTTQMTATYDLHCFQISFSWTPTGQWKSWFFRINAKAAALADLLQYKRSTSQYDQW